MTSPINKLNSSFLPFLLGVLFIATACNNKNKENTDSLSVTIEPQRYFLEQIVGDKYKVTSLVPQGSNPETFEPSPSQMMALDKSKAYFKIGFLGIENTLIEKIKNQSQLNIIDCSNGVAIIQDEHQHAHDHDHDHAHHHHAHAGGDPHYWSSINSAKAIVKNMYDAIVSLDPENKDIYTSNYNKEIAKINETDSIISSLLANSESKAFIIYHPALSYFAQEYGLEQLSIEHEGKNPSPAQLKALIDKAKEKNIKAVFIQKEFDVKNAEIIAQQIEAQTYSIDPLSYNWHDEMIKIAKTIANKE